MNETDFYQLKKKIDAVKRSKFANKTIDQIIKILERSTKKMEIQIDS